MNKKFVEAKENEKIYFYPLKEMEIIGLDETIKENLGKWYAYKTNNNFSKEMSISKGIDILSYLIKQLGNFSDELNVESVNPIVKKRIGNLVFKCKDIDDKDVIVLFEYGDNVYDSTLSVISSDYINQVEISFREFGLIYVAYARNNCKLNKVDLQDEYVAQMKQFENVHVIELKLVK